MKLLLAMGCSTNMWQAVGVVSWEDIVSKLKPFRWAQRDACDVGERESLYDVYFGGRIKPGSYEWMVSQGLL